MECKDCEFMIDGVCLDPVEFVRDDDGELCCRYHPNAVWKDNDNQEENYGM